MFTEYWTRMNKFKRPQIQSVITMAENIQVVVRVRPLSASEHGRGCTQSIRKIGDAPQIMVNNANPFTFNRVYMPDSNQEEVYSQTISGLLDKLFEGFNCTVLAYGQTGSGKTYTMGTNYVGSLNATCGIIPRVIQEIFERLDKNVDLSATITCSFMELYQEDLLDLLSDTRKPLDIREVNKNIEIPNLSEIRVHNPEDTFECLVQGSARRVTGSTAMNETSSRSHAIFTIHLKVVQGADGSSAVSSKFHLVDLAGSERVNKTKATGERFKEGVKINQGLLCLGNVISALGTGQKTVSFRESKLTRLLQGSLGGNSVTLMIACVSPADYNLDETLSTLRYANRAKQIKNKPVVNRDPNSEEILRLNDIILRLRNQLAAVGRSTDANADSATLLLGGGGHGHTSAANEGLKVANMMLVNEVAALQLQLHSLDTMRDGCVETIDRLNGQIGSLEAMLVGEGEGHKQNITEALSALKATVCGLKVLLSAESDDTVWHDVPSRESLENSEVGQTFLISNQTFTEDMKRLKDELTMKEHLARKLLNNLVPEEESHAIIASLAGKIAALEQEKNELSQQKSKQKPDVAAKLAEERRKKIGLLEKEIDGMKRKITKHEKLMVLHKNTQKNLNSLQSEILALKQQKVQLVKNLRKDQDKFRQLKIKSDREMNVMREKEKKRFHEMKKLEAQHERQKAFLQRRVEEANIKARRAENLLNKQRRTKRVSVLKEPQQIERRLNQELEIIYFVSEVKASLTVLMEARTELTSKLQLLDRAVPEEAARIALLEAEIEERTHTINDLQMKIQAYDMTAKVESIAEEVQPNEALKILLDQVSDMQEEHFGDKLKWEAAENAFKGQIEELQSSVVEHNKKLLKVQRDTQEDMALLLDGYWGTEEGAAVEESADPADKLRQLVKNALDEAQSMREQNEMLKEELAAATRIMQHPKKAANKHVARVAQEEYMDSETDGDFDNSDVDPDWSFSEEKVSLRKRSLKDTTVTADTSNVSNPPANNTSTTAVHCNCKTDCSRKNCSCRKSSMYCNKKCKCLNCANKDRGSASDDQEGATGVPSEEVVQQDGKRIKLCPDENVDMNNTQFKYPYLDSKPVFYS